MIFLRFPDEQTYLSAVAPYMDDEGNVLLPGISDISDIGEITIPGEQDIDGTIITPSVLLDGYHVNMLGDVPPEIAEYVIDRPKNPYRVFAGY